VIDTELFTLPDNDPSVTPVEKLPIFHRLGMEGNES